MTQSASIRILSQSDQDFKFVFRTAVTSGIQLLDTASVASSNQHTGVTYRLNFEGFIL